MIDPSDLRASDKILTLPSSISIFRIFLAIPTAIYLLHGDLTATAALMVFAYITDILDGYIARKTNMITEFGKAIDPVADKIYVAALVIAMVSNGMVPLWFVVLVIGKDVIIMIGVVLVRKKIKAILPSNYWGKSAILLTIICLFLAVCGVSQDVLLFGWVASTALIVISFFIYAMRAVKLIWS
jgi:CDP-diacylglycerol--glycerol-3-phosphate 3-phosphatidyltransferase